MRHCISELESLAIEPKKLNDLNDAYEMADLVTNIKLNWYQDLNMPNTVSVASSNISLYFSLS
jgi:hypothetical protein